MHISVLIKEAVESWKGKGEDGIYIDATFGEGGHTGELLKELSEKKIKIIGLDLDPRRIKEGKKKFAKEIENQKLYLISEGFENIKKIVKKLKKKKELSELPIKGVLFDLGFCSTQLEEKRGFSFKEDQAKLDMRFNEKSQNHLKASEILNNFKEEELKQIFKDYGEERYSSLAAKAIVKRRAEEGEFKEVKDLLPVLKKSIGRFYLKSPIHFATRTFQALRIACNRERENIKAGLSGAKEILAKDGIIAVISFHSGEDRIVKHFFKKEASDCVCPDFLPICRCDHQKSLRIINRKPIISKETELKNNPRARSAKLRVAQKII